MNLLSVPQKKRITKVFGVNAKAGAAATFLFTYSLIAEKTAILRSQEVRSTIFLSTK